MFVVIWEYEVKAGAEPAFEALYGADGLWVSLFREHPGFIATELLRCDGRRYVTIDRWSGPDQYQAFLTTAQNRYADIDAQGDMLTRSERHIGAYQSL